jgi:hypothetical protein
MIGIQPEVRTGGTARVCPTFCFTHRDVVHPRRSILTTGVADVIVHVEALASQLHSGLFGGPAPDPPSQLA